VGDEVDAEGEEEEQPQQQHQRQKRQPRERRGQRADYAGAAVPRQERRHGGDEDLSVEGVQSREGGTE